MFTIKQLDESAQAKAIEWYMRDIFSTEYIMLNVETHWLELLDMRGFVDMQISDIVYDVIDIASHDSLIKYMNFYSSVNTEFMLDIYKSDDIKQLIKILKTYPVLQLKTDLGMSCSAEPLKEYISYWIPNEDFEQYSDEEQRILNDLKNFVADRYIMASQEMVMLANHIINGKKKTSSIIEAIEEMKLVFDSEGNILNL